MNGIFWGTLESSLLTLALCSEGLHTTSQSGTLMESENGDV